jgi:hypothetical protein
MERQPAPLPQEEGHHPSHQQYLQKTGVRPGERIHDDLTAMLDMKRSALGMERNLFVDGCLSARSRHGSEPDNDVRIRATRRQTR